MLYSCSIATAVTELPRRKRDPLLGQLRCYTTDVHRGNSGTVVDEPGLQFQTGYVVASAHTRTTSNTAHVEVYILVIQCARKLYKKVLCSSESVVHLLHGGVAVDGEGSAFDNNFRHLRRVRVRIHNLALDRCHGQGDGRVVGQGGRDV